MAGSMKTGKMRELKRRMDNMKAVRTTERAGKYTVPALQAVKLPGIATPKLPKPAAGAVGNGKGANMFYTKPENRSTIVKDVRPITTAPQGSRMTDTYREAMEQRMQGGTGQSLKDFLRKQGAKGGGNTASVGEFQQRLYEQAKPENDKDFWEGFRRGIGAPQQSRMDDAYREAMEQRMQEGDSGHQSLKDILGQISTEAVSADNEDISFWDGFRRGLGLKDGEEIGGGRPGDIGFSATDVMAHRPGIYQDDNEYTREELEEDKRELQEEILELLWEHGYDEDELTGELMNDLLYNGTGLGEDHDKFVQLVEEINRINERIIYLYTSEEIGEYDLNDTEYLQGLIATGETCFNFGGADALDSFLENNHISRIEYYNARRALQEDMGDAFDGFIAELPGAEGQVESTDHSTVPTTSSGAVGQFSSFVYGYSEDNPLLNANEAGTTDSFESDMAQIAPALESMMQVLDESGDDDVKIYIEGLLEDVLAGEEFDTSGFFQKGPHELILGNEIYWRDFGDDDIRSEMEVLNAATVNLYNEQGETLDDIIMNLLELFLPSDSDSDSSAGDLFLYWLEEMVDSIKEHYDPGKILQDGDVRISTQTYDQITNRPHYTHYFFRDSEFLYSINTLTGEIVYGENYDEILADMIQETIDQMP